MTTGWRQPPRVVWGAALCVAVALHAGGFAAAWSGLHADEPDDALGAPAIEIGLDMTSPHKAQPDLPPGHEADASAASASQAEQQAKLQETDLPKARPTETDDPDRLVAPDANKKPPKHSPTILETRASPSAESVASEAAAPPSLEAARETPYSVAPVQGSGESANRVKLSWQKQLVAHLNRFKRHPGTASRQGTVIVTFSLDRLGHVLSSAVQQGSGDSSFDQAALTMMKRADPVPAPPPLIADEGLTFSLPVIFRDKKK